MKLFLELREAKASTAVERRGCPQPLEYRAAKDGKPAEVSGYAVVWGAPSGQLRWFTEEISKGAFTASLADAKRDVVALAHHDWAKPLARRSAGTLTLTEDEKGLFVRFTLADTTVARDLQADIAAGNVKGFSFGMEVVSDSWGTRDGVDHRTVTKANLFEVSPVTWPAYEDTNTDLAERSFKAAKDKTTPPGPDTETRKRKLALMQLNAPAA